MSSNKPKGCGCKNKVIDNSTVLSPYSRCSTTEYHQRLFYKNPLLKQQFLSKENELQKLIKSYEATGLYKTKDGTPIITIPVVVHVVWRVSAEDISDTLIKAQLDILTQNYRRTAALCANTPVWFLPVAADTQIEFKLANIDQLGNPTTGIERRQTNVFSWTDNNQVKFTSAGGLNAWDSTKYLNLWSCNLANPLLGYGTFPGGAPNVDGVVIKYSTIGSPTNPGTETPFDIGGTAIHEVGHWLNLRHIWGDEDGCVGSDLVSDTPNQSRATSGNPTGQVLDICGAGSDGSPASNVAPGKMYQNYMDYTYDLGYCMFTIGQTTRMIAALNLFRQSLFSSPGLSGLTADFVADRTTVVAGGTVTFTDLSSGAFPAVSWSWSFPGGSPSTSIEKDPVIQYNEVGTYDVTLTVADTSGLATSTTTVTKKGFITVIVVNNSVVISFLLDGVQI